MSNMKCPNCGGNLTEKVLSGELLLQCYVCCYSLNTKTGKMTRLDPKDCVTSPQSNSEMQKTPGKTGGYTTSVPKKPAPSATTGTTGGYTTSVPKKPAPSAVTGTTGGHTTSIPKKPTPAVTTMTDNQKTGTGTFAGGRSRTITIKRLKHAYRKFDYHGLKNAFMDNYPAHIFLDGADQGVLSTKADMTLVLNEWGHNIKNAIFASSYCIPAGNDSYLAYLFNDRFMIGPVDDPYRDQLTNFVVEMFRGNGIRDRILSANNRNHCIDVNFSDKGIRLFWQAEKARGIKQWLTGEEEEWITYSQIGLSPLPVSRRPDGYWEFLDIWVTDAIVNDSQANMEHCAGGITLRSKHNLF